MYFYFQSGAFVVLKTDMLGKGHPPVWKIDGKALLQKYVPFTQDGKTLYKNTSVVSTVLFIIINSNIIIFRLDYP